MFSLANERPDDIQLSGTLRVALTQDIQSLEPYLVNETSGETVVRALFDHLLERDTAGEIVPGLATHYNVVDSTTIDLTLREDVTFHNGEPFNSDSVVFSIEHFLDPEENYPNAGQLQSIARVEAVNDYKVRLHLKYQDVSVLDKLTAFPAILPPVYYKEMGSKGFAKSPVGTGPFVFDKYEPSVKVIVNANHDYWLGSYKGQAEVGTVEFYIMPNKLVRLSSLKTGAVDIISNVSVDFLPFLREEENIHIVKQAVPTLLMVWINADSEDIAGNESLAKALKDVKVRQAFNYAVDSETLLEILYGNYGTLLASPMPPLSLGYDSSLAPYPYDADMAVKLLQEADFPFAAKLQIAVPPNLDAVLAESIVGYLQAIGVNADINLLEQNTFNDAWIRDVEPKMGAMFIARWSGLFDPENTSFFLVTGYRASYYRNEKVDENFMAARETFDQAERANIYKNIAQRLHNDPAGIYLWQPNSIYAVSDRVEKWHAHPRDFILVSGTAVQEE